MPFKLDEGGPVMSLKPAIAETEALRELAAFPLVEALYGRRSRRFALGDAIPDGPLAYRSRHKPPTTPVGTLPTRDAGALVVRPPTG